ncbi:MAG: methionyl-tRNA formyltransferase [bacterium]|nr:methionyl-tRNA formyltransferase [bacterium]
MRILFMGTAEFAVPTLAAILKSGHQVIAVVTQPDRPFGRGLKLRPSPVKEKALQNQLPVLTPESVKDQNMINQFIRLNPEVIVVVAYGKILPPTLLEIPKFGCINVHGSLLPKYRGAAPIQWTLIRGETETGVTTMYMNDKMDEGDIMFQEKISILPEDNYGTLSIKLAQLGGQLIIKTLSAVEQGSAPRNPQNEPEATYAPKIKNTDGLIDWTQPATAIVNLIRGVTPAPGAFTLINGKRVRILAAKAGQGNFGVASGQVLVVGKHDEAGFLVQSGKETAVQIVQIQPESGKIMSAAQFARGYKLTEGIQLGI